LLRERAVRDEITLTNDVNFSRRSTLHSNSAAPIHGAARAAASISQTGKGTPLYRSSKWPKIRSVLGSSLLHTDKRKTEMPQNAPEWGASEVILMTGEYHRDWLAERENEKVFPSFLAEPV
jgi:hypothetical protein